MFGLNQSCHIYLYSQHKYNYSYIDYNSSLKTLATKNHATGELERDCASEASRSNVAKRLAGLEMHTTRHDSPTRCDWGCRPQPPSN